MSLDVLKCQTAYTILTHSLFHTLKHYTAAGYVCFRPQRPSVVGAYFFRVRRDKATRCVSDRAPGINLFQITQVPRHRAPN